VVLVLIVMLKYLRSVYLDEKIFKWIVMKRSSGTRVSHPNICNSCLRARIRFRNELLRSYLFDEFRF
jgi:hypothetical protein